jgi:hypothetical protein
LPTSLRAYTGLWIFGVLGVVFGACSATNSVKRTSEISADGTQPTSTLMALNTSSTLVGRSDPSSEKSIVVTRSWPGSTEEEIAEWEPYEVITPSSVSFMAAVRRLTCNTGITGRVFPPLITYSESEVVVTFNVESTHTFDCPGNRLVIYRVDLSEPVGNRRLVDGSCLNGARQEVSKFGSPQSCSDEKQAGFLVPHIPSFGPQQLPKNRQ